MPIIRPSVLAAVLACGVQLMAQAADAPALTIYSGDFDAVLAGGSAGGHADIVQPLPRDVPAGRSDVVVTGLPAALDLGGVQLRTPAGVEVTAQRYDVATATPDAVLARALGKPVTVYTAGGSLRGTLLGAGANGLTLGTESGVHIVRDYVQLALPALPDGLAGEPTLRFGIQASRPGQQRFELRYPSGGLGWRAEYTATLADGAGCRFSLSGAALIANRSGASFQDASLTLIAGEPRRSRAPMMMDAADGRAKMTMATSGAAPEPRAAGDYHAYALPGRTDLPDGSAQRVPLLGDAPSVPCERRYETQGSQRWWGPGEPLLDRDLGGSVAAQPVLSMLAFDNAKSAGLGVPMPAGRVRVSEADGDLLGEANIDHTPAGETLRLELGEAFDLRAERKQTDFALAADGRALDEALAVELRNAGRTRTTVRVIESLPRWSDWEISAASTPWTRVDAQTVAFDVPVPAQGKASLSYRVRYRLPARP